MLLLGSVLAGYEVEADDGAIGTVEDFLFDDGTWKLRWLVVETRAWPRARRVLIHPAAIVRVDYETQELFVKLTVRQVEQSPDVGTDRPVSTRIENSLYEFYGWDRLWGETSFFGPPRSARREAIPRHAGPGDAGAVDTDAADTGADRANPGPASPGPANAAGAAAGDVLTRDAKAADASAARHDPHLRSVATVTGYHVLASDGEIGHVEDVLIDHIDWSIHYLVIDTRNWWPGQHVMMSPYAVSQISALDHHVRLNVARAEVMASPPWDPLVRVDLALQKRIHSHYRWPGYGW